jgi:hypothetical protein
MAAGGTAEAFLTQLDALGTTAVDLDESTCSSLAATHRAVA